jgi:hypothetical protein
MDYSLPEEHFQQKIETIIEEVLQEKRAELAIRDFSMREGAGPLSVVECVLLADSRPTFVSARGEGIVDALFAALAHHFHDTYHCLETVAFDDFTLKAHFKDSSTTRRTDAPVEITLVLKTDLDTRLYFRATSKSLVSAAIEAVRKSIEFLINCEKTVTELYLHIEDLRHKGRHAAEEMRVLKLAEVVRVANFEETIKKIKWQTKKHPHD